MTPEALIVTSDFELGHMARIAVERLGIGVDVAMRAADASKQLSSKKFDVVVVDCGDMQDGCATLRAGRASRTNRSAVNVAIIPDLSCVRAVSDAGANFVLQRSNYEPEIAAILRSAYGLILRERGRYNRFPVGTTVQIRCGEYVTDGCIVNISQGGLCIAGTAHRFEGPVQLRFALEAERPPMQATANAAWHRDGRVGFQFTNMPSSSRSELNEWLAQQFSQQTSTLPALVNSVIGPREDVPAPDLAPQADPIGQRGIHAIVTAIIRGGPVRARCSQCKATITFGNTIGAPLDQERKLREAFAQHLREKHPAEERDSLTFPD